MVSPISVTTFSSTSTSPSLSYSAAAIKKELCTALTYSKMIDHQPLCISGKWIRNTAAHLQMITEDLLLKDKIEEIKAKILVETNSKSSSTEDVQELRKNLSHYEKQRSINPIDYSSEDNLFVKGAIELLDQQKTRFQFNPSLKMSPLSKDILLRIAVHFTFKNCSDPTLFPLIKKYDQGLPLGVQVTARANTILDLLFLSLTSAKPLLGLNTTQERNGLLRICQHRFNLVSYIQEYFQFENISPTDIALNKLKIEQIVKIIQSDIEALQTNSSRVILMDNGDTSFTIPGGWLNHYISFEFRRNRKGEYFFVIYNKGEKSDDERFHCNFMFISGGKVYGKTRVPIKVSKDVLTDKAFLQFLIQIRSKPNSGQILYDELYRHLVMQGRGEIIESEQEKIVKPLFEILNIYSADVFILQRKKICDLLIQILKYDPNYHRLQKFGTCSESNLATVEREMAPPSTLQALQQGNLISLLKAITQEYFFPSSKIRINKHSSIREIQNVITDITKRTRRNHAGLVYLSEIRNMLTAWLSAAKTTQKLQAQIQISKSGSSKEILPATQRSEIQINKKLTDIRWATIGIKTRIYTALKLHENNIADAKRFYVEVQKNLTKIQNKLKAPPKIRPKLEDLYRILQESVELLINQSITDHKIFEECGLEVLNDLNAQKPASL